jgi:DNA-binding transcriptional ArsR family regulator
MLDFWLEIKGILRAARQRINAALAPLHLSSAEGDILFHLLTGGDCLRQEQLAERLDIGKAAVSRAVDSLEEKGYVVRIRQTDDRRAFCVRLTDKASAAGGVIVGIYNGLYSVSKKAFPTRSSSTSNRCSPVSPPICRRWLTEHAEGFVKGFGFLIGYFVLSASCALLLRVRSRCPGRSFGRPCM